MVKHGRRVVTGVTQPIPLEVPILEYGSIVGGRSGNGHRIADAHEPIFAGVDRRRLVLDGGDVGVVPANDVVIGVV